MNIYQRNGFRNRKEYLLSLADFYNLDIYIVYAIAETLGSNEDFDGLITMLEDIEEEGYLFQQVNSDLKGVMPGKNTSPYNN